MGQEARWPSRGLIDRRGFLQVVAAAAFGLPPIERWFEEWRALGMSPEAAKLTPFITPNGDFYLVAVDPSFRPPFDATNIGSRWALELTGTGGRMRPFGYDDLLARATRKIPYTFECIGNEVGGELIGNAQWHVIPLRELLAEAPGGVGAANSVMFTGLDDFYSSVSVARALDDRAFIALRMNGMPLPASHGFPARVILPDLYGMKQPRWLRRIVLQEDSRTTSFWEERGWAGEVPVKTMSRLDRRDDLSAAKPADLTGIAFAGARGVSKVEVSLDGGSTWAECELVTPPTSGVWGLWRYRWTPANAGRYRIEVRATDARGELQSARRQPPFPDGASGYDGLTVAVRA
jgi:DMSO/TMAO reductase YedYZ molybdopterin-dependent catalytic subunit